MARFAYRGLDKGGASVRGDISADTREAAIFMLGQRDLTILELIEGVASPAESIWERDLIGGSTLPDPVFARIAREMAVLTRARVPVDRMLAILERTARDRPARRWLSQVAARVREGETLPEAFAAAQPKISEWHLGLIRAGDVSGALDQALAALADYLEKAEANRRRIRSALVYPAFVLVAAFVTLILLVTLVLPTFEGIFASAGQSLPEPANSILVLGKGLRANAAVIAAGAVTLILLLLAVSRSQPGRIGLARLVLALPIIGPLRRQLDSARFARTAALLTANGVQIDATAQAAVASIGNAALRRDTETIVPMLVAGDTVATALRKGSALDPLVADMAEVGAEAGQLPILLGHAADLLDAQTEARAGTLVTLIAPVATIVLGGLVAIVIMSVMSAMLQLNALI